MDVWEAIRIDFVSPLPESSDRDGTYNAIITIINLLTGMVHLVPSLPNAFSRPPSPSMETSMYENTFEFNQGDNLDPDTRAAYLQAENGMTDEQYANYQ